MTGMRRRVSAVFVLIAVNAAIFAYELLLVLAQETRFRISTG